MKASGPQQNRDPKRQDQRGKLDQEPFSYRRSKNGTVFLAYNGRTIKTLSAEAAQQFVAQINGLSSTAGQLVMAKLTGNFKRGNERPGK